MYRCRAGLRCPAVQVLTVDDDTRNLTNTVDYLRERVDALYSVCLRQLLKFLCMQSRTQGRTSTPFNMLHGEAGLAPIAADHC